MKKEIQHLRRSQFVFTYGPGAIIESKIGPRIIPSMREGLGDLFDANIFHKFEITNSRLRIIIQTITGHSARILALPTNASLNKPSTKGIYHTYIFPMWRTCYGRKGNHPRNLPILFRGKKCPLCKNNEDSTAVRFVAACTNGHLDDVDWHYAVHSDGKSSRCKPEYYYWRTGGSSLSDIVIECPNCGATINMGNIYRMRFPCSGRHPENEKPFHAGGGASITKPERKRECNARMRVLQRQSSSLRIPETITLLTIPEYDNSISNLLQKQKIATAVISMINSPTKPCQGKLGEDEFIHWLQDILTQIHVPTSSIEEIVKYIRENGISEFCRFFENLHGSNRTFTDFMYEELESFLAGPRTTDNFSMASPVRVKSKGHSVSPDMDVFPVYLLKTVTAQIGYRRMPYIPSGGNPPKRVSSGVFLNDDLWYPGFEGTGEGVFITFANGASPDLKGSKAFEEWSAHPSPPSIFESEWNEIAREPLFVWLHTLSHALIKTLSLHSGYSSTSLRERVYVDRGGNNGGILIYTTSPGEDGSMGGLTGSVDSFEEILDKASDLITFCSNDPLCHDVRKSKDGANGAACHSCLLISETSCEHRNVLLDRHLILGD